jgi:hypothetical protein
MYGYVLSYPNSPVLSSVAGCTSSNGSMVLIGCRPGDVIIITGQLLNSSALANIYISWLDRYNLHFLFCNPLAATDTTMQCQLPYVTEETTSIQEGQLLTWSLTATAPPATGSIFGSQPFQMTFTWQPRGSPGQSAGDQSTAVIAVAVLVPVLVIALAVAAWLWYRRAHKLPNPHNAKEGVAGDEPYRSGGWSNRFGTVEME